MKEKKEKKFSNFAKMTLLSVALTFAGGGGTSFAS
jgi:hypothetical protein